MMQDLQESEQWSLGYLVNSEHPFFSVNKTTVLHTWAILLLLLVLLVPVRWILKQKKSLTRYTILSYVRFFIDMCNQALPTFSFTHFSFITVLFTFIMLCNVISVIPPLEEPTTDLNTCFALGLISFLYTQIAAISEHGILGYIKDYFAPFFLMLPLNIVGKIASVISISFRLFGNIFGGSMIANIYAGTLKGSIIYEALGLLSGINIIMVFFFGIFEGFLQAFVFTMLTLTYLSMALQEDGH